MIEVRRTERFARWLDDLRDLHGRARIQARIERLAMGNPGDVAPVGEGVSELRVDVGPDTACTSCSGAGPSSSFWQAGSKRTQAADIRIALQLARGLPE